MQEVDDAPLEAFTWTPERARELAFSQSGASNCGATALLNVLSALEVKLPSTREADRAVKTNLRRHGVPASEYLAGRSVAGTTAEAIVAGCEQVAGAAVESRFFHFYPPRAVELRRWLSEWLAAGGSAVATLNTQAMYGADYWHHQMIFGVSGEGVFVTNGIETLSFDEIGKGLESPSVLRVRASDALGCSPLDAEACDGLGPEWARLGVSRQLRELASGGSRAEHVEIPASYNAGVTVFARAGSEAARRLRDAPELPLRGGGEEVGQPAPE